METSRKLAGYLLQSKSIILNPANPFTWSSGWKSPIYCDNRKTLSYPEIRDFIRDNLCRVIKANWGIPDIIAGVATGAIAHGALVADRFGLPFIYVRSSAKDHGTGKLIEGEPIPGKSTVVVEDLVSTGGSSLRAVETLRVADVKVLGMIAIFSYGFSVAEDNFRKAGVKLVSLTDYNTLLDSGVKSGYISAEHIDTLKKWREAPHLWMQ